MPKLFIAISVSDEYKKRLDTIVAALNGRLCSKVNWTRPTNWHVTLQFLGQVEDEMVDDIRSLLRLIKFPVFSMRANDVEGIPNMFHPRVIWVAINEGSEQCIALAEAVMDKMDAFGFKRGRPCIPHVTLGRVKQLDYDDFEATLAEVSQNWPMLQVKNFSLYESKVTREGPIYTVVEDFSLRTRE